MGKIKKTVLLFVMAGLLLGSSATVVAYYKNKAIEAQRVLIDEKERLLEEKLVEIEGYQRVAKGTKKDPEGLTESKNVALAMAAEATKKAVLSDRQSRQRGAMIADLEGVIARTIVIGSTGQEDTVLECPEQGAVDISVKTDCAITITEDVSGDVYAKPFWSTDLFNRETNEPLIPQVGGEGEEVLAYEYENPEPLEISKKDHWWVGYNLILGENDSVIDTCGDGCYATKDDTSLRHRLSVSRELTCDLPFIKPRKWMIEAGVAGENNDLSDTFQVDIGIKYRFGAD